VHEGSSAGTLGIERHGRILALFMPIAITLGGLSCFFTSRTVCYGGVLYEHCPLSLERLPLLLHTYRRNANRKVLFTGLLIELEKDFYETFC